MGRCPVGPYRHLLLFFDPHLLQFPLTLVRYVGPYVRTEVVEGGDTTPTGPPLGSRNRYHDVDVDRVQNLFTSFCRFPWSLYIQTHDGTRTVRSGVQLLSYTLDGVPTCGREQKSRIFIPTFCRELGWIHLWDVPYLRLLTPRVGRCSGSGRNTEKWRCGRKYGPYTWIGVISPSLTPFQEVVRYKRRRTLSETDRCTRETTRCTRSQNEDLVSGREGVEGHRWTVLLSPWDVWISNCTSPGFTLLFGGTQEFEDVEPSVLLISDRLFL